MYFPLFISRILTVSEFSICAFAIAHYPNPEISLAALGGVILPIAFLYECPIYDLITSSNTLCKNWANYKVLRKFFIIFCSILTVIGIIIFCTPLADYLILKILKASPEICELAKPNLIFVLTWPWTVGYRRMVQGVLICHKRAKLVSYYSIVRVLSLIICLCIFGYLNIFPAATSATLSLSISPLVEALLVHLQLSRMYKNKEIAESDEENKLNLRITSNFYLPLVISSFAAHLNLAIASWGMFRMADSFTSLAVWGAIAGIFWMLSSIGHAFTEVAIFFVENQSTKKLLFRISAKLSLLSIIIICLIGFMPFSSDIFLSTMLGLKGEFLQIAKVSFVLGLLFPTVRILSSLPYAILLKKHKTKEATKATFINIIALAIFLALGANVFPEIKGIYFYMVSSTIALGFQYLWMLRASNQAIKELNK